MTKLFSIIAVAIVATSFVACGPSADDKAKMLERANFVLDSTTKATQATQEALTDAVTDAAPATPTDAAATTPTAATETEKK